MNNPCKTLLLLSSLLLATVAVAADTITGTVHNQTTSQPAVGDQVVLLRLGEGMQEEGRTKTDAQGRFTLNVTSPNDQHLIQVSHQGVSYDQSVTGTAEVEITVYDTAPSIPGMRGPIGIAQVESDGKLLKITEMYDIRNNSEPPVTQSRTDNFAIALPANAELDFAEVRRGQGIWTKVKPDPVKGKSGKFRLNYPIRPGDTLFKFIYHLPYEGPTTLHLRVPYPIEKFAVMHPPTMVFKASRAGAFISPDQLADNLKVEAAVTVPTVGDVPAFQISGVGISPPHGTEVLTGPRAVAAPAAAAAAHPPAPAAAGAALEQSRKELWFMLTGMVVILALAVFAVWRIRKPMASAVAPKSLLDTLKDELFQLENDRLRGAVSAEEYAANKQALNRSIRRLLEKQPRR